MSAALDAFRASYLASIERFNEHDFEGAFSGLPDDIEWHPLPVWQQWGGGAIGSREEVVRAYEELRDEFPSWRTQPQEFLEVADGVFAVRALATAEGRSSGVPVRQSFTQLWQLDASGTPVRVRDVEGHPPVAELERIAQADARSR